MKEKLPIWMNLYRGGIAIVFGILLLFMPDKSKVVLFNLMGFFWLTVGLALIRRGRDDERYIGKWPALVIGLVGIATGLLVITRHFTRQWMGEEILVVLLGIVVLITGVLHMFSEVRVGGLTTDIRTALHFLLGIFEVLLGALLIFSRGQDLPYLYWIGTAWAFIYGALFVGSAVYHLMQSRQKEPG